MHAAGAAVPADRELARRSRIATWLPVALLLAIHVGLAWWKLDAEIVIRPDATNYLIGARAIGTGNGYCDLSQPEHPPILHPVGMSLLLSPVVGTVGYHISACKLIVVLAGLVLLVATFLLTARLTTPLAATMLLALLAFSPVTLFHDVRIFSQVPYTAAFMVLLLVISRFSSTRPVDGISLAAICLLALACEKIRTQGIVIWPALLIWGSLRRDRVRIIAALSLSWAVSFWIDRMGYNGSGPGGFIRYMQDSYGGTGFWTGMSGAVRIYSQSLAAVVVPDLWPDLSQQTGGYFAWVPASAVIVLAVSVAGAAAFGMVLRHRVDRGNESLFVALYLALTIGVLLVWPHRPSRLFYPMVAPLAIYSWSVVSQLPRTAAGLIAAGSVICYGVSCASYLSGPPVTGDTTAWITLGETLTSEPPETRILTSQKLLFLGSKRFQRTLPMRAASYSELNQILRANGSTLCITSGADSPMRFFRNPGYRFSLQRWPSGLAQWTAEPNYSGVVPKRAAFNYPVAGQSSQPRHIDLARRAHFHHQTGDYETAESLLRQLLTPEPPTAPDKTAIHFELANVLLSGNRPEQAVESFRKAMSGETADNYLAAIIAGLERAEQLRRLQDASTPSDEKAEILAELCRDHIAMARWDRAGEVIDQALREDPQSVESRLLKTLVLRRLGQFDEAITQAEELMVLLEEQVPDRRQFESDGYYLAARQQAILARAAAWLARSRPEQFQVDDQTASIDLEDPNELLGIAQLLREDGQFGVALRLLRTATNRHDKVAALWFELGNEWAAFGRFREALTCLRKAQSLANSPVLTGRIRETVRLMGQKPVR